ncbi:MarR family transcriptional regulator, partial [Actinospica sp. MGRD01-02]|nr:MarR family transcriptional regulator [Actinospica acidithermotolerans]
PDPADRRRVLVHAAERGLELHGRVASAVSEVQSTALRDLGDKTELATMLERLADAFDRSALRA